MMQRLFAGRGVCALFIAGSLLACSSVQQQDSGLTEPSEESFVSDEETAEAEDNSASWQEEALPEESPDEEDGTVEEEGDGETYNNFFEADTGMADNDDPQLFADENKLLNPETKESGNMQGITLAPSVEIPENDSQQASDVVSRKAEKAELNHMKFRLHFGRMMAGHAEGVFYVRAVRSRVRLGPGEAFETVGILERGDFVHGITLKDQWLKIGRAQYVPLSDLRNAGLRTPGAEQYRSSAAELAEWEQKIREAEEQGQSSGETREEP